ncbi:transcriptional regulator [Streptacidiphilus pinicola]|uniref:Transcriptional regulator n=2 Tax=Streptacidiphilus pinicola TaxID=2219663 RepID=A0A2X0JEJ2_9ACTN|nr:transcriptional regulator [Streptacidiphilus pinicola]
MSQSELAGGEVSPSYISLIESGRRMPSEEIAQAIAERLGVPLSEFGVVPPAQANADERADLVRRLVVARSARAEGGSAFAAEELVTLVDEADSLGEDDVAWEASWELAETYGDLDQPVDRDAVLRRLLDDPLTNSSIRLRARVAAAIAELAQSRGRLPEAVRAAEQAVAAAAELDASALEWCRARLALIAAYTACDDLDRAGDALHDILDRLDELPTDRLRGLACWAAADLHVATGHPADAVPLLERAAELLPPRTDLRQSARLALTTVRVWLATDRPADAVDERLGWTRHAFSMVGTEADRVQLAAVEATVLARKGLFEEALSRADDVRPAPGLPPHELAESLLAAAEVQMAGGRAADGEKSCRRAAELFDETGTHRRAARAWRTLVGLVAERGER